MDIKLHNQITQENLIFRYTVLKSLEEIYTLQSIEIDNEGTRTPLHSHTAKEQGLFLQKIFSAIKPSRSLEVGFAYGISAMFILEMHQKNKSEKGAHIVIEPDSYWGNAALHNIEKEGLLRYIQIKKDYSDKVLARLFLDNYRIQYAYIDTTKQFDVVMQDFYFINKILDVGGVVILDDCGGICPGVQRVARFISTLPHYKIHAAYNEYKYSFKKNFVYRIVSSILKLLPFKQKLYETINFKTDKELGLNFDCIAFIKTGEDKRSWEWDATF